MSFIEPLLVIRKQPISLTYVLFLMTPRSFQKCFSPIVIWPWRFCPPALLSSSNWIENNFREQQPNEDNFLPVKKLVFLFQKYSILHWTKASVSSLCLFILHLLRKRSDLFQTGNPFSSFQMSTTIVYHCLKLKYMSNICFYEMFIDPSS